METTQNKSWLGQPRGLKYAFNSEMFERMSFYTMRNMLVLFMTQHLLFNESKANLLYGMYNTLIYITPLIGGYIADKFLGFQRSILFGGILMAIGQFILAVPINSNIECYSFFNVITLPRDYTFFLGMSFLIIGNGYFKPNVSSLVGTLYEPNDQRRDRGYSIFYMGINIGSVIAAIISGYCESTNQFHLNFACAGIGMLVGIVFLIRGKRSFGEAGLVSAKSRTKKLELTILLCTLFAVLGALIPLVYYDSMKSVMVGGALLFTAYFIYILKGMEKEARNKMIAAFCLMLMSVTFYSTFEQAGSSLQLFVNKNVNTNFLGFNIPSSAANNFFNPFFIIILTIPTSYLFAFIQKRNNHFSSPLKFSIGIILVGLGFYTFASGAIFATNSLVPMIFVIIGYLFHTIGELFVSPVGLSTISKLSPIKYTGFMFGAWFLASAYGQYLASLISNLASINTNVNEKIAASVSLSIYQHLFTNIGHISISIGIILLFVSPLIRRLMSDVN